MVCLWICAASAEYGIASLFVKHATFSREKRQDSALSGIVSIKVRRTRRDKRGTQYAVLISAATQRHGMFIALFLTRTVYTQLILEVHV